MRIGARITLFTTALVISALGVYGFVSVRIRRAELYADLERQTEAVGNALKVALEAALREGLYEDVRRLVRRIQEAERPIGIVYLELKGAPSPTGAAPGTTPGTTIDAADAGAPAVAAGSGGGGDAAGAEADGDDDAQDDADDETYAAPPRDEMRDGRIRRILIDGLPHGEQVERDGKTYYAFTVPLRDQQRRVVAVIDLTRDESDAGEVLAATQRNVAATVIVVGSVLALLVLLITRRAITHPLKRLVEGIDEVSHGDLTRVILREGEDEIADLADRFNEMTTNLREARVETQRGVEAKLALEAKLRQSDKLATIGQLAAAIAHEVGTPLNVIGGRARTMEKKSADPAEVAKNAGIIAAQATRIARIIQRLLDYARQKTSVRARVDLQAVVKDTVDFLELQLSSSKVTARILPFSPRLDEGASPATAATESEAPSSLTAPLVVADADQLQQVCLNLFINAIQAMPTGGTFEIATRAALRRKPGLDLAPPSRYIVLEVSDEGVGIPPEDLERVFEPFYSTKHDGGGTGLGLAVTMGIVKDHDGWIDIESGPKGRTVFRVFLPASEPAPIAAASPSLSSSGSGAGAGEDSGEAGDESLAAGPARRGEEARGQAAGEAEDKKRDITVRFINKMTE